MRKPSEIKIEKVTRFSNGRKINRIYVLLVFEENVSEKDIDTLMCFFSLGHIYNTIYTSWYMWFLNVYYKNHYIFPDGKRVLVVLSQPEGERFYAYIMRMQIEEICTIVNRHLTKD